MMLDHTGNCGHYDHRACTCGLPDRVRQFNALTPDQARAMSVEARRNYLRGPAPGVCGQLRQRFDHCMRDWGHAGEHEFADLSS